MRLLDDARTSLRWLTTLASAFFTRLPMMTTVVVAASALSLAASIVAFVLPLKIVFLVGSDGVSEWFRPFVAPQQKGSLVVALTVVTVLSVFASIGSRALCDRLAASASRIVLRGANELALVGDQLGRGQTVYAQFADVLGGSLFCLAGLLVIGIATPPLVVVLIVVGVAEFALTAHALERRNPLAPGRFAQFLENNLRTYLNALSSCNFLIAFAVLLYPFVWGSGGHVMAALISIIVLRRILAVLLQVVVDIVSMVHRKGLVDALVFREQQYRVDESDEQRTLRDLFGRSARHALAERTLRSAGIEPSNLSVRWRDSRLRGLRLLAIRNRGPDGHTRHYLQQIYLPRESHRAENEAVLFSYLSRERLHAPPLVTAFSVGPYSCQICQAGAEAPVSETEWQWIETELQESLMSIQPPEPLVQAYVASHPMLPGRLTDSVASCLTLAVDDDAEAESLERLRTLLPTLRERLARLPLYIRNPEAVASNCYYDTAGTPCIITWGKWQVEPVPAGLAGNKGGERLQALLERIRQKRDDIDDNLGVDDMRLGLFAASLERLIASNRFNEALAMIPRVLALLAPEPGIGHSRGDAAGSNPGKVTVDEH